MQAIRKDNLDISMSRKPTGLQIADIALVANKVKKLVAMVILPTLQTSIPNSMDNTASRLTTQTILKISQDQLRMIRMLPTIHTNQKVNRV